MRRLPLIIYTILSAITVSSVANCVSKRQGTDMSIPRTSSLIVIKENGTRPLEETGTNCIMPPMSLIPPSYYKTYVGHGSAYSPGDLVRKLDTRGVHSCFLRKDACIIPPRSALP